MDRLTGLSMAMVDYEAGCPARIQHFIKVHSFARNIGLAENLDNQTLTVLEAAAIVHDIGILPALKKYGRCDGPLQEKEGPEAAQKLLEKHGFEKEIIERVCYLVGHHHTYNNVDGLDYQILIEADFLVNLYEGHHDKTAVKNAYERIFKTKTGKWICQKMFE